jgi:xanthine dehydrogenase YagS FAD-binding subunit
VKAFAFVRPRSLEEASSAVDATSVLKASGIDLLDRMKERVDEPSRVVALLDVPGLRSIEAHDDRIRIGALVTLAELAASDPVRRRLPSLAEAAGLAASPQLRHRATVGGNLAQHTRCGYYRHRSFPCFKRGDASCPVLADGAVQETAGVFGNGACASAHPSSLAPVFGTLDATVVVHGKDGERRVPFEELWQEPVQGKASDTTLAPGDVIVAVESSWHSGARFGYHEVRQKAAFDWALVSAAVRVEGGDPAVNVARVWLGSVAPTPWRAKAAEKALFGSRWTEDLARGAATAAVEGATPLAGNAYKTRLVEVAVRRALLAATSNGNGRP